MTIVKHLLSDVEYHFDKDTTPEHALAQVYCEDAGLSTWYYNHNPNFEEAHRSLSFLYGPKYVPGPKYVCLGDYVVFLGEVMSNNDLRSLK